VFHRAEQPGCSNFKGELIMPLLSGFNANEVAPAAPREPVPEGKYVAVIIHSEVKATRTNTGSFLELTFEIIDGPHTGRTLKARLNLDNPNAQAVQIARAELSAVCRAVGVLTPEDSTELHQLPLFILVKVIKRRDNGEPTNEIGGYIKRDCPQPGTSPTGNGAAGADNKTATPPWKRP
jgi:hypothetical protein